MDVLRFLLVVARHVVEIKLQHNRKLVLQGLLLLKKNIEKLYCEILFCISLLLVITKIFKHQ